jgi:hypothetical protein
LTPGSEEDRDSKISSDLNGAPAIAAASHTWLRSDLLSGGLPLTHALLDTLEGEVRRAVSTPGAGDSSSSDGSSSSSNAAAGAGGGDLAEANDGVTRWWVQSTFPLLQANSAPAPGLSPVSTPPSSPSTSTSPSPSPSRGRTSSTPTPLLSPRQPLSGDVFKAGEGARVDSYVYLFSCVLCMSLSPLTCILTQHLPPPAFIYADTPHITQGRACCAKWAGSQCSERAGMCWLR